MYFLNTFNDFQNKAVSSYETFKIFIKRVHNKKAEQNCKKKKNIKKLRNMSDNHN